MIKFVFKSLGALMLASLWGSIAHAQKAPNIDWREEGLAAGALLAAPNQHPELDRMGRLAIIETLGDYIITIPEEASSFEGEGGSHFLVQQWDLSNPRDPQLVTNHHRTNHPYQAHGTVKTFDLASQSVQIDLGAIAGLTLAPNNSITDENWIGQAYAVEGEESLYNASTMFYPWTGSQWGSYGPIENRQAELYFERELVGTWDHLGLTNVIGFPLFMGNLMIYPSDQANGGMATYDVSNPSTPVLLDHITHFTDSHGQEHPIGGYWSEIYGHYVVFAGRPNDVDILRGRVIVVDFSDPENLNVSCFLELSDEPMYVNFQDEYAFLDGDKVNLETCEVELTLDQHPTGTDVSQYALPLGNILVAGGVHLGGPVNSQGMSIWVHQTEPDLRAPYVTYHIPRDGQTNFPTFAPISIHIPETLRGRTLVPGQNIRIALAADPSISLGFGFQVSHSGLMTINPNGELAPNTTYIVTLNGIEDYMGNAMAEYQFEFTTASNRSLPTPPVISEFSISPSTSISEGDSVELIVVASDDEALTYRFDTGLGAGFGAWNSVASVSATYPSAGTYIVRAQVRDASGSISDTSNTITVSGVTETPITFANNNSQLSCQTDFIWAVNPDNNVVAGITKSSQLVDVQLRESLDPRSVLEASDGNLWVAGMDSDAIDVYSKNGILLTRINTHYGSAPFGLVESHDGSTIYATLYGSGELASFDVTTKVETGRVYLGPTPRSLAITADDSRILVTRFISTQNEGQIWDVDAQTLNLIRKIPLLKNAAADTLVNGRGIPNYVAAIAISPTGNRAYYVAKKDNTDRGLLTGASDLDDDNAVRAMLGVIDLESSQELYAQRVDFDNREGPSALAFSPEADYLFVSIRGNNEVLALPLSENDELGQPTGFFATGLAPQGLCMDEADQSLYVKNFLTRSVTQLDLSTFLTRGALNPPSATINTVESEILEPTVLAGKRIFYNAGDERMSAEGYISCASCHVDGGHDGRTWDFTGRGEGLRNTISLLGREGASRGNVHWSGNFDEIQDFEHDIRSAFKGLGFLSDEQFAAVNTPLGNPKVGLSTDLDNLAAYVNSLGASSLEKSPAKNSNGTLTAAAELGANVFLRESCASCHSGEVYTDGLAHDVGTLRSYSGGRLGQNLSAIRTPSLLGAFSSAPYLHDGSAATLVDVFTTLGGKVYQAEDFALIPEEFVVTQSVFENFRRDETHPNSLGFGVRLRAWSDDTIIFRDIDGGAGGEAILRLRAMAETSGLDSLQVFVNGQAISASPISVGVLNLVNGEQSALEESAAYTIALNAGEVNTVRITKNSNQGAVYIDDITISNIDDIQLAYPHSRVRALPSADQEGLVAFLQQLDGYVGPVTQENFSPYATNDVVVVDENTAIQIAVATLLANDGDANQEDTITLHGVGAAANGVVSLDAESQIISYTPNLQFVGIDSFQYTISDGLNETTAIVELVVNANTPPVGVSDSYWTLVNEPIVIAVAELLSNDVDEDNDTILFAWLDDPNNGSFSYDSELATVAFTPDEDFVGEASFFYIITDGKDGGDYANYGWAQVFVSILGEPPNTLPLAMNDIANTYQNRPLVLSVTSLLANDHDEDEGDVLTIAAVNGGVGGGVVLENNTGEITFTPDTDFTGEASFEYTLSDGRDTATASVVIAVEANSPPWGHNDYYSTRVDESIVINISDMLNNDIDQDGDVVIFNWLDDPSNGRYALDLEAQTVTFTPAPGYTGEAKFFYIISDGKDGGNYALLGFAQAIITVLPNAAPIANDDFFVAYQNKTLAIPVASLLANDSDEDDMLEFLEWSHVSQGSLSLGDDGVSLIFNPDTDFVGAAGFQYTISDGRENVTAEVSIDVQVNSPPVGQDDTYTIAAGDILITQSSLLLANDQDADNDSLNILLLDDEENGVVYLDAENGEITFIPDQEFTGTAAFTYLVTDGKDGGDMEYVGYARVYITIE